MKFSSVPTFIFVTCISLCNFSHYLIIDYENVKMCIMGNGNDPSTRILSWKFPDENHESRSKKADIPVILSMKEGKELEKYRGLVSTLLQDNQQQNLRVYSDPDTGGAAGYAFN